MSEPSEDPVPYGLAGLANIGNTCYANSILQVLRVIPEWSALMERDDHVFNDNADVAKKIFMAYQDIARTLWSKDAVKGAICRPMAFWRDVRESVAGTVYDCFRESRPQDAHEFLSYLLDQCHEALKVPATSSLELYEQLSRYTSPVVDTLFGWDRVQCICKECGSISTRYEPFNTLKVGLNNTIECPIDLLEADRLDEEIEDYACNKCATRTNATIRRSLWKLPKTVIYMLRRFRPDGSKDSTAFNYNGEPVSFERLFAKDAQHNTSKYRPIGTIEHMGSSGGGHYFAQAYHPLQKEWYIFDDERGERIEKPRFTVLTYIIVFAAESQHPQLH